MKSTLKKFLSITLVVSMLMSMCTFAFAASDNQVMDGYYVLDEDGKVTGTTTTSTVERDGFKLDKTIKRTGKDAFDITLKVQTEQIATTNDAAVQLVIDTSGSMAGSRITAIKNILSGDNGFIKTLAAGSNGGKVYLSIVTFSDGSNCLLDWTDISTNEGMKSALNKVGTLPSDGGTNLEAGLILAGNRLTMDKISSVADSNKYTIVLSDGAPTYYCEKDHSDETSKISGDSEGDGSSVTVDCLTEAQDAAIAVKEHSKLYTIYYGSNENVTYQICKHCGIPRSQHTRNVEWKWFIIFYPEVTYTCADGHTYEGENVTTTLYNYLSSEIASDSNCAYTGTDADAIKSAFSSIASATINGMSGAGTKVTDPMGQYITLGTIEGKDGVSASGSTLTWMLDPSKAVKSEKTVNGNKVTTYTYTVTYPVTLNTAAEGFQEKNEDGSDKYYPTNGYTYLSVPQEDGTTKKIAFNVPGVKGEIPEYPYTINYLVKDKEGNFKTLDSKTETVPMWTVVSAEEGYANKYSQLTRNGFFGFYKFASVDKQDATMTITEDGMVMNLRYEPVLTSATVNHNYITIFTTDGEYQSHRETGRKPEVTTSLPVGEEFSAKKAETDGYTFAETKEIGEDTFTSGDLTISALNASEDNNVINLYYFKTIDTKSDVSYTVKHTYNDKTWKLENGTWVSEITTKTPEDLIESHTGKHGETVTGTPNKNSVSVDNYKVTSTDLSITLDKKNGKNVIEITYYRETGKPEATTWVVNRHYKTITAQGEKDYIVTTEEVPGTIENGCVLEGKVGEKKSVEENKYTTYNGDVYKPEDKNVTTIDELSKNAEENVIDLYYVRDAREEVTVIVNHTRYTYKDVLNEETGLMKKTQVGEPDTSGSGTVSAPNGGKWYKGMTFSAKQDAKGYNFVSADPKVYENITLNGNTEINFVYETYTPNGEADVTVYHNYRTYKTYVNDAGKVVRDELVHVDVEMGEKVEGKVGERYQFKEVSRDGFVPDNGNAVNLTGKLVGKDGRVDLYYNAYEYPETTTVTVVRHYGTYTKSIDEKTGEEVRSDWTENQEACSTTYPQDDESTVWYPGQTYTANTNNYSDYTGYSYDTVKTTDTSCKLVADGEQNVIDLYYFNEATNFVPVTVIVRDHYTDTIHYIENGEAKTRVVTDTDTRKPVTTKRMNEFYKADSNSNGFVAADTNVYEKQLEATGVTVTIDNKEYQNVNYIDLYYTRENSLKDAKVKVNHYYEVYSMQTGELIESDSSADTTMPWSTGWKENQYYTPTPKALGFELYKGTNTSNNTWVTGEGFDGKYTMQLAAGENVINLFYRYAKDTRVDTTVTVYHVYKVYDDYTKKFVETDKVPTKDADVIFGRDNGAYVGNEFDASRYAAPVDDQEFGKFAVEEYQEQKTFVIGENGNEVTIIYVKHIDTTPIYDDYPPVRPENPVTPPEDIDEPDVPLAGDPEIEDLGDDDVPLAGAPNDEFEELEEEEVPLAAVPKTSDMALFWLASSALSGIGLGALNLKKREDEDEQ